ncbi:MAG TPA: GNAT family N-acetyltransferase [Pyrinomonadaceae bacterium]
MRKQTEPLHLPEAAAPVAAAPIVWQWSAFADLSVNELYAILQARQRVFVVEQACPYLDADGYDARAWHLLGWVEEDEARILAAYARIFAPGVKYDEASIGRVMTHASMRGKGLGEALMGEALRRLESLAPKAPVRIGAQMYLERFYEKAGFRRVSAPYDEDGILHIEMLRAADAL